MCFGLVYNELYRITSDPHQPAFIQQCRASYGFLYDEPHDPAKHGPGREDTQYNDFDGKYWAKNQIHWMISQSENLVARKDPDSPPITRLIKADTEAVELDLTIVKYEEPGHSKPKDPNAPDTRPNFLIGQRVEVVETIRYKFPLNIGDRAAIKKKVRARFGKNLFREYWKISYRIRMVVDGADMRFELVFNGEKRSSETDGRVPADFDARGNDIGFSADKGSTSVS